MLAYLFPGQGSQVKGMGKELFDLYPEYTAQSDDILGYSIKELCLEDPEQQLNQTQFTQPAIYTVNALAYLKAKEELGGLPDYVAGHSLGEYNALFAAEVFDFATGLTLVKKRGEVMKHAKNGGMAAIIGMQQQDLIQVLQEHDLTTVTLANHNSYRQLVISGPQNDIERTQTLLSDKSAVRVIPLAVSGAFHSPYMLSAQQEFAKYIETFEFAAPKIPVIANIDAKPYHPIITKSNLINQITSSVEWVKTMEFLLGKEQMNFKEVGPGTVLTSLMHKIKNKQ